VKVLFKPHWMGITIDEAMEKVEEFASLKDMCEFLVKRYGDAFCVEDIYISYAYYDNRIDWDTYHVTVGRFGDRNYMEMYRQPQMIGSCTIVPSERKRGVMAKLINRIFVFWEKRIWVKSVKKKESEK
jgi:hypothetical protein